jgi:hypothetical protein
VLGSLPGFLTMSSGSELDEQGGGGPRRDGHGLPASAQIFTHKHIREADGQCGGTNRHLSACAGGGRGQVTASIHWASAEGRPKDSCCGNSHSLAE